MEKLPLKFIIIGILIITDAVLWSGIIFNLPAGGPEIYFLEVGQGDSSLVMLSDKFSHRIKILIDAGAANGKVQRNLEKILPARDRYIDLAVISHPQLDHFGGFIDLLEKYEIGAIVVGPAAGKGVYWLALREVVQNKKIPVVILNKGSEIVYADSRWTILSPERQAISKNVNELSLVMRLDSGGISALFTGDIGEKTEAVIAAANDVNVDILKVSHHGSRFSSNSTFLREVSPAISVIAVGKNSYGHPTDEVLRRLAAVGSQIYRTDQHGLVKVAILGNQLKIFSER